MIFTDGKRLASTNSISELKTFFELILKVDPYMKEEPDKFFRGDHYLISTHNHLIYALRQGTIFTSKENIDIIIKGGLPQMVQGVNLYILSRDDFMDIMQVLQSCSPSEGKKDQVKKLEAKLSEWLERS